MSRPLRFSYPRAVHHVTLRCNNRKFLFDEPAWALFAELRQEARRTFPIALYHYCLMTNHVHLLFQVGRGETLSRAMHWLGNTFSRRFNKARRFGLVGAAASLERESVGQGLVRRGPCPAAPHPDGDSDRCKQ